VAAAAGATWFLGMRNGWAPVVDAQRRVNRDLFNPRTLARAGRPGDPYAVVHHTGRSSGRSYSTPVGAAPTEDGFVVASVYGTRSDWIRNVLAGGPTTVLRDGRTVAIASASVVPLDSVARYFPENDRRSLRAFGVSEAVRLTAG